MTGTEETELAPTPTTLLLQVHSAGLRYSTFLFSVTSATSSRSANHQTLLVPADPVCQFWWLVLPISDQRWGLT